MSWNYKCHKCKETMLKMAVIKMKGKTIHHYFCPKCDLGLDVTYYDPIEEWKD